MAPVVTGRRLITKSHSTAFPASLRRKWYSTEAIVEKEEQLNPTPGYKQIGTWLTITAGMVFGIVVVGGITRLTESGLSIVEWKPVTGILPPITQEEWTVEFEKYKQYPEFKRVNSNMKLEEFKQIFFWEWAHRVLGRTVGVVFALPFAYFMARKMLTRGQIMHYSGLLAFGGAQGALGWYMVKSGLEGTSRPILHSPHLTSASFNLSMLTL